MAVPKRTEDMPFIFTNGIGKAEPDKRKLIRKYVMLGKNRGKTRKTKLAKTTAPCDSEVSNEDQDGTSGLLIKMRYSMIPNKIGSELSFTQFAATVEPQLIQDVLKFSLMAKKVMYPLESCINFHRKNKIDTLWFELLTYDAAYMHAVVFSCQAYFSLVSARETPAAARRAGVHHSITLQLLRERLSIQDEEAKVSDPTVFVVLCLAGHAHFIDDYNSAKNHMEGLRKIVDMRGGINAFSYNQKLSIELLKCDLGISLDYGTEPMFFRDPLLEPLVPYDLASSAAEESVSLESELYWKPAKLNVNADLARAWTAMKRFCSAINSAAEHNRQLPKETLLNTIASVMYRLLRMNSFDSTSIDEAVRLGLLAFASHIFLRWQNVKLPHTYFRQTYRKCLLSIKLPDKLLSQILLWLLMVGAMSLFTPSDDAWLIPWVRVNIELCGAQNWSDLRRQLKVFPWINFLHDKPGQTIFDSAVSSGTDAGTVK